MILGAVLAGGASTRFGSDKAEALWHGRPLLAHSVDRIGTICTAVIVCGREDPAYRCVPDRPRPGLGPLGGLNAALHFGLENGFDRVVCVPCDAPLLPDAMLARLARGEDDLFLVGMPVIGRWRSALAPLLDAHLDGSDGRSMRSWAERVGAAGIALPPPPNVNHRDDLAALDRPG